MKRKAFTTQGKLLKRRLVPSILIMAYAAVILAGCAGGRKPGRLIEQYTLEYSSPSFSEKSPLTETVKVERFTVAEAYNTFDMVYRPDDFKLDTYRYHRWRVSPGDMVTDYLSRDLRESGLFRAVFSWRDVDVTRFVMEGGVTEFVELTASGSHSAVVSLTVTLLDMEQADITKRVVFQKSYRQDKSLE
jgi:cholesterol transport system auxiliary component